MGKLFPYHAVIKLNSVRLVLVGDLILRGECKRCGECCKKLKCENLGVEMVDDKPRHFCRIYFNRPISCALWPKPNDVRPEGCGFYWEKL